MSTPEMEVAERAHAIWSRKGRPPDTQVQDWFAAEAELRRIAEQAQLLVGKAPLERGQLLQAILDNPSVALSVKDVQGRYLLLNRRFESLFGVGMAQGDGKTDYDFFPAEIADTFRANDLSVLVAGVPQVFEEVAAHGDGVRNFSALSFPICGVGGTPYAVCSIATDITDRKQAVQALLVREREFSLARAIQQRHLPTAAPVFPGFDIGGTSLPAQETGGDYLDYIPLADGSLGVAVGDASGHGIAAALLMAETRAYLRALAGTETDVGRLLSLVNRHVTADCGEDDFVTLCLVRLDPRSCSLVHASSGHWPGYVLDGRGERKGILGSTGLPLGIDPAGNVPAASALPLEEGDLILLLTDGIVEAFPEDGPLFGAERVLNTVRSHRHESPDAIVAALLDTVCAFSRRRQIDDMTAVVIKVGARAEGGRPPTTQGCAVPTSPSEPAWP